MIATYCFPFFARNVIGDAWASVSIFADHNSLPVRDSSREKQTDLGLGGLFDE